MLPFDWCANHNSQLMGGAYDNVVMFSNVNSLTDGYTLNLWLHELTASASSLMLAKVHFCWQPFSWTWNTMLRTRDHQFERIMWCPSNIVIVMSTCFCHHKSTLSDTLKSQFTCLTWIPHYIVAQSRFLWSCDVKTSVILASSDLFPQPLCTFLTPVINNGSMNCVTLGTHCYRICILVTCWRIVLPQMMTIYRMPLPY